MPPLFEKPLHKGKETRVRESDKRKFRERVLAQFPTLSASQLDSIVPPGKSNELKTSKIGSRDELYRVGIENQPIFFTHDDLKGALIPTCYTLHIAPQMLRTVPIFQGVETKIVNGANVFAPGIVRPSNLSELALEMGQKWPEFVFGGAWKKGDLCAVLSEGKWAPCAVGRFSMSPDDVVSWGLQRGTIVDVLHHMGDELWCSGSRVLPQIEPPVGAEAALIEYSERLEAAAATKAQLEKEHALKAEQNEKTFQHGELLRRCKKVEKTLRQLDFLREQEIKGIILNVDQQLKLSKDLELRKELEVLREQLLSSAADEDKTLVHETVTEEESAIMVADTLLETLVLSDEQLHEDGSHVEVDPGAISAYDEERQREVDATFSNAVITVLYKTTDFPILANIVFARATCLAGGLGIKSTKWRKTSVFISNLPENFITMHEILPGTFEITAVNFEFAPDFIEVLDSEDAATLSKDEPKRLMGKKKGGLVMISMRKVRGKNITVVDNLDTWGFTKESLDTLAKELRHKFSTSVSIGPRQGSEAGANRKTLWSLQLQGRYADEIKVYLQSKNITTVKITDTGR